MPGRPSPLGPNLAGVVGRKAGTTAFNYTAAMKASGLIWTKANLEKYHGGPRQMVPGTKMVIAVPDAAQRNFVLDRSGDFRAKSHQSSLTRKAVLLSIRQSAKSDGP